MSDITRNAPRGPMALIRLGYACNNNCIFCHSSDHRGAGHEQDIDRIKRKIRLASEHGAGTVVFSGGEPTIRKDILDIFEYTHELNLGVGLITNGRMFCYPDFTRRVADIGLEYILVSIHGPDAKTHNMHTGVDSFRQSLGGLAAISGSAARVVVNTVLTRRNAAGLAQTARLLERFAPIHFKISLPEPRGAVLNHFDIVLSTHAAAGAVENFLMEYEPGNGLTAGIDGLTPCLLADYSSLNDDFFTHGFYLVSEPGEDDFFPPSHGLRGFDRNCMFCSMRHLCPGIYVKYFEMFPGISLTPLKREVSNAVRFDIEEVRQGRDMGNCEWETLRCADPARRLAVRKKDRLDIFVTREIQTATPELMTLKYDIEQVYKTKKEVEIKRGFPAHLRKLQLTEKCRACGRLRLCPGVYTIARKQPFATLKKRVYELLDTLAGRVFEVGCGSEPYAATMKKSISSGRISYYLGIDPALPLEIKTEMQGRYVLKKGLFEEFRAEGEKFDSVIMFRSYNHLADLRRAGSVLSGITTAGSKIIIIEDCKCIELKKEEPVAGGQPAHRFEHMRNHTAQNAAEFLRRTGFEPEVLWEPDMSSAGCWAVAAQR